MTNSFADTIIMLRREKSLSQKDAAKQLGISQALLSHYERGIRECGLDFLVKIADFYEVSVDFLLGRTSDRNSYAAKEDDFSITFEQDGFPNTVFDAMQCRKQVFAALNVVFDLIRRCRNSTVTNNAGDYLKMAVYNVFRTLSMMGGKNAEAFFTASPYIYEAKTAANMQLSLAYLKGCIKGVKLDEVRPFEESVRMHITPEQLEKSYPSYVPLLVEMINSVENKMG